MSNFLNKISISRNNTYLRSYYLEAWASEGGARGPRSSLDFEIISKKRLFFQFRGAKSNFTTFGPPLGKKFWENPQLAPPWKKSFRRPCLEATLTGETLKA